MKTKKSSGGSALKKLRTNLKEAGIIGTPKSKASKRQSNASSSAAHVSKAAKLRSLQEHAQNPFEFKVNRQKHEVMGRKIRGSTGNPGVSRKKGFEKRQETILKELVSKDKVNIFNDRRFGESDANLTIEEKMMERFVRDKKSKVEKGALFNLDAEEEDLTHFGQSLSNMDDIADHDPRLDNDEDDPRSGGIGRDLVKDLHFGGGSSGMSDKKKSYQDIMKEVIAKSKFHKHERQKIKEEDEDIRRDLNEDFDEIRDILFKQDAENANEEKKGQADEYDVYIKELAFEKKARPTDRLKTDEELAKEEAERLMEMEKERRRNMMASNDGAAKKSKVVSADALDDDFEYGGITMKETEALQFKNGKLIGDPLNVRIMKTDEMEYVEDEEDEDPDLESIESDEVSEGDYNSQDLDDETDEELLEMGEDVEGNEESVSEVNDLESDKELDSTLVLETNVDGSKEIPFVFEMPKNYTEFVDLFSEYSVDDQKTVLNRLMTLYHPSVHPENPAKQRKLLSCSLEHFSRRHKNTSEVIQVFLENTLKLAFQYTDITIAYSYKRLKEINAKFIERCEKGLGKLNFSVLPSNHVVIILLLMKIFPTSDFRHDIMTPLYTLIANVLMKTAHHLNAVFSRNGSQEDSQFENNIANGLLLCHLFLDGQTISKRYMPEVIMFIRKIFRILLSIDCDESEVETPLTLFRVEKSEKTLKSLRKVTLKTIVEIAEFYSEKEFSSMEKLITDSSIPLSAIYLKPDTNEGWCWEEVILPFLSMSNREKFIGSKFVNDLDLMVEKVKSIHKRILEDRHMFMQQIGCAPKRPPLQWQKKNAVAIRTSMPKFDDKYNLDRPRKNRGEGDERKLRSLYKKEMKGAVRELKKDASFLANQRLKEVKDRDKEYKSMIKRVNGMIGNEAGEAKAERSRKKQKKPEQD